MTPALEKAGDFLAAAKAAINTGDNQLAGEYLELAKNGIRAGRHEAKIEAIIAQGRQAMDTLKHLEQVRRLCVYGLTQGKGGAEAIEFAEIMSTRPPIKADRGLAGITPALEWLGSNRRQLSSILQNLAPSDL